MAPTSLIGDARRFIGRSIHELPTPCLTLDLALLEANLTALQAEVSSAGKSLRAHAKSHKSTLLAARQLAHGAVGICAAKLSEAERLVAAGISGVLLTGPAVSPDAHERLTRTVEAGGDLIITLDSEENARAISRALARGTDRELRFLLDLDIGQQRTGVAPAQALELAARLSELPQLRMVGVQAYAGHLQHLISREERREATLRGLEQAREIYNALRSEEVATLSVGGTGSYSFDLTVPEVTEVQAGSYALMDADYLAVEPADGATWRFAPALKLRATVLSAQQRGFVTIDAGLKSIYRDGPAPLVIQPEGGSLCYDWFGDEYGRISGDEADLAPLKVGASLALVVSHCDPTVNLFDFYFLIEDETVVDLCPIDLRGCSA